MIAIIRDNHYVYTNQVTPEVEDCIIKWFSVRNPRAYYIDTGGSWDGWYRRYNVRQQRLTLPFLSELRQCCAHHRIPLDVYDERPAPVYPAPQPEQITETLLDDFTLEQYQVDALRAACKEDVGIFDCPTGSGKTELMCGLIKMFRCPTVVIAEKIVVLEEIVGRLHVRNVVHNNDIGLFCHGNMPDGNLIIVGSIQSLSSPSPPDKHEVRISVRQALKEASKWARKKEILHEVFPNVIVNLLYENPNGVNCITGKYLNLLLDYCRELKLQTLRKSYNTRIEHSRKIQGMIGKCDLLLVDEADLGVTQQYSRLFKKYFCGRRRFGFSGTPFDKKKPVQNLILRENLGNIIYSVSRKEVQDRGRIIPIKAYMIAVGDDNRHDVRAYDIAIREEIVGNAALHALVANLVKSFNNEGTLILIDTSPLVELGYSIEAIVPNSKFIFGETPKPERRKYIELFEKRQITCLIGSTILKRGLDLDGGVENLVIIGGGAKHSELTQMVGRAVRINSRGWARVFGFFFLNNKYLYKHSREHLKALVKLEYPTKVIIGGTEVDGKDFIKSKFRLRTKG